jgi:hypothetical protein
LTNTLDTEFTTPASEAELEQVAAALRGRGFDAHVVPDVAAARERSELSRGLACSA